MRAVNLLPREAPTRRGTRPSVVVQLALVAPLVAGSLLAAGYLLASSKVNDRKATLQALRDELAAVPTQPTQHQGNSDLALQRDLRIAALSTALQGRVAWDRILSEISSVLPEDVWLTSLSAESPKPTLAAPPPTTTETTTETTTTESQSSETTTTTPAPAPAPPTGPLKLIGYTYSQEGVARLLSRLAVIPELQDVKLLQSSQATVASQIVVSFSIQASVRGQEAA